MWEIDVICSDAACSHEFELWVEDLEEVDRAVCPCGCCVVTLTIAVHEPIRRR
jgi:hypothetical protein